MERIGLIEYVFLIWEVNKDSVGNDIALLFSNDLLVSLTLPGR